MAVDTRAEVVARHGSAISAALGGRMLSAPTGCLRLIGQKARRWGMLTCFKQALGNQLSVPDAEGLPLPQAVQPHVLTAGDEHLPAGDALEDELLPPLIQLG